MGQEEIARGKPGLIRWVTFTSRGPAEKEITSGQREYRKCFGTKISRY